MIFVDMTNALQMKTEHFLNIIKFNIETPVIILDIYLVIIHILIPLKIMF